MKIYPPVVIQKHSKACRSRAPWLWSTALIEQYYGNHRANQKGLPSQKWYVFQCNDLDCAARVAIHANQIVALAN